MTLYELRSEYLELLQMLEDPEIDQQVIEDTLEAVGGELEIKCDNYGVIIKELEAEQAKLEKEIERLNKNAGRITYNITRMKKAVMETIQLTGERKMTTDHFKMSIVRNGGKQPIEYLDGKDIPKDYMTTKPVVNSEKIREDLEAGMMLDFAVLKKRGEHLSIK